MKPKVEKRVHIYWTEEEHGRFLTAVSNGLTDDYPKMKELIGTKTLQQVIDYKTNFIRKVKRVKNHPERKYLYFFSDYNKKQIKEEREFFEFLDKYKHEWRHYYEESFPGQRTVK